VHGFHQNFHKDPYHKDVQTTGEQNKHCSEGTASDDITLDHGMREEDSMRTSENEILD
jgi:hypothetical protein